MFMCCCCNLMFYDWSEWVMSVLGTTKHSPCNQCIDTWQQSCIILCTRVVGVSVRRGAWWKWPVTIYLLCAIFPSWDMCGNQHVWKPACSPVQWRKACYQHCTYLLTSDLVANTRGYVIICPGTGYTWCYGLYRIMKQPIDWEWQRADSFRA